MDFKKKWVICMKNFEAYEDKIKELEGNIALNKSNELVSCIGFRCYDCKFDSSNGKYCSQVMFEWLYEEYKKSKIKIPLATKVILESLNDKYEWIAKDKNGQVWVYGIKPIKDNEVKKWFTSSGGATWGFKDAFKKELFNFLSWEDEEPTNIKELLENCEVIEDE